MITPPESEWLETDGEGGFASGTISGVRTRRYHGLLLIATKPPEGRLLMVSGLEVFVEKDGQRFGISSQRYWRDVIPPPTPCLLDFRANPWPRWTWRIVDGLEVEHEIFIHRESRRTYLSWRMIPSNPTARLVIRPFLAGRDYHSTHHENGAFHFASVTSGQTVTWQPYESLPAVQCTTNGSFAAEPMWYRNFQYSEEQARGLDFLEDLAAPGVFTFPLPDGPAVMVFGPDGEQHSDDMAMTSYGLNHLSEIADGDTPRTPRGCPFQAWSLGEFLRLKHQILQIPT